MHDSSRRTVTKMNDTIQRVMPVLLFAMVCLSTGGCRGDKSVTVPEIPVYPGKKLVWSDEFDGTVPDPEKWVHEIGDGCPEVCGWGNNELEYYTDQNAFLNNGHLVIEARKESKGGKPYTSSRIVTRDKNAFAYGRVDARAKLPFGQGIWPAIWMLGTSITGIGWPACGEIDIMEMIGGQGRENTIHGTAHWDNDGQHASFGKSFVLNNGTFADDFHLFSIEWDSKKIEWYVDDVLYNTIDITPGELDEFRKEFFIIINLAVGGNWPGHPDDQTAFPQRMTVDYIRVYQDE